MKPLNNTTYLIFLVLLILILLSTPLPPLAYVMFGLWGCVALWLAPELWRKPEQSVYLLVGYFRTYITITGTIELIDNLDIDNPPTISRLDETDVKWYLRGMV